MHNTNRYRLLAVLKILQQTSRDNPVTVDEICTRLINYDLGDVSSRSVQRDLDAIYNSDLVDGFQCGRNSEGKKIYWIEE